LFSGNHVDTASDGKAQLNVVLDESLQLIENKQLSSRGTFSSKHNAPLDRQYRMITRRPIWPFLWRRPTSTVCVRNQWRGRAI